MPQTPIHITRDVIMYDRGKMQSTENMIVRDIPLTIFCNDKEISTLICSPGDYNALAVGFLCSEGLVQKASDIKDITCLEEKGIVRVQVTVPKTPAENLWRNFYYHDECELQVVQAACRFHASQLLHLMRTLDEKSVNFRLTGGLHSAALADNTGILVRYEDIGRHNAVDRVLGYTLLKDIFPGDKCLLHSGRNSSEMLLKAARRGIPLLLSRSATTNMAVELAERLGITIVGFARGEQLTVYTHAERLIMEY